MSSFPIVYTYWKYDNVIDDKTVDKILKLGEGEWETATTMRCEDPTNEETRKTDIIWNNEQWLYDAFWGLMNNANENAGWNLEISAAESFQLGRYADGGHYDYHTDGDGIKPIDSPGNEFLHGKTRKISMVCWLNEDFEGGEFEFHPSYLKEGPIKPTKGTVIFFPAWHMHKVHPVTEGERFSLVTWFNGFPLK